MVTLFVSYDDAVCNGRFVLCRTTMRAPWPVNIAAPSVPGGHAMVTGAQPLHVHSDASEGQGPLASSFWPCFSAAMRSGLISDIDFLEQIPLFMSSPIRVGGMGFSTGQIGYALLGQGIILILHVRFIFPLLKARFGPLELFKLVGCHPRFDAAV